MEVNYLNKSYLLTSNLQQSFCKSCKGKRVLRGPKTVTLNVMAGVDNNETIKVPRSGGADPDGNQPGAFSLSVMSFSLLH
ncbi:hypothetical protein F511_45371 [Dorcoceras hygrometricum]|uniref:Uncharacterized protein n=1 Tax=Dorcoceras hygrometricum TaxID=472368 RepID=A0A2Z6ZW71_9LAMI|nr:hypothetical protein F511_45371 [Dorcoceras hygrometricum]